MVRNPLNFGAERTFLHIFSLKKRIFEADCAKFAVEVCETEAYMAKDRGCMNPLNYAGKREENDLREFFLAFYPLFVSFAQNYVQSRAVCEDVVQESFVAYLEQGRPFAGEYKTKAFLYKTVRNKCLNHLRHEQIHNRYAEVQSRRSQEEMHSEEFFIGSIVREEASLVIAQAIEALPAAEQRVLNMAVEGLSNQEVAERLGISINTVRTHKSRAYKALRVVLANLKLL